LEILAIIDKTENAWQLSGHGLAAVSRKTRQKLATVRRELDWLLDKGWLLIDERAADGSPKLLNARNYWKFHKRREPNGAKLDSDQGLTKTPDGAPSYPNLSDPTLTGEKKRKERSSAPVERTAVEVVRPTKTQISWEAYQEAYTRRYHARPVRNAKVNGTLGRLVDRVGAESAPKLATFYLGCEDPFYLRVQHSTEILLRDCEKLHTQMVTGRRGTTTPKSMVDLL
jgi:hypothetical protein